MGSQAKLSKKKASPITKSCTSKTCTAELQSLKAQLLASWKERLALHDEAKRLQACLDRREDMIKSLKEENEKLRLQLFSKPSPTTPLQNHDEQEEEEQERYKYEEEKGVVASHYTLNIEHKYASDEELVDESRSPPNRLKINLTGKKKKGKDKNEKKKRKKKMAKQEKRKEEETEFNLEISDLDIEPLGEAQRTKCNRGWCPSLSPEYVPPTPKLCPSFLSPEYVPPTPTPRCPSFSSAEYVPPGSSMKRGRETDIKERTEKDADEVGFRRSTRKRRRLTIED
ncbi:hypothetical protein TWF694_002899 [Orbilia ellipsospora]|uniref:Uncharacterized protein n=1 Tax=Orbilia ellipsospora TaxID=2528407 RepID=A0AAV9X2C2_9PEZI